MVLVGAHSPDMGDATVPLPVLVPVSGAAVVVLRFVLVPRRVPAFAFRLQQLWDRMVQLSLVVAPAVVPAP